jgi:carbonic anhydrase/acetyltransferase-like protein (isoleucine patch superfamily)
MIIHHQGKNPSISASAYVAPNAVICGDVTIGENCRIMFGAQIIAEGGSIVIGSQIEDEVFIATGAAIFHGARLGRGSEVRVNGVVHLKTSLPSNATVPIGWVAIGDSASILLPDRHDDISKIQRPLSFPLTVYGIDRDEADMVKITRRVAEVLASHHAYEVLTP